MQQFLSFHFDDEKMMMMNFTMIKRNCFQNYRYPLPSSLPEFTLLKILLNYIQMMMIIQLIMSIQVVSIQLMIHSQWIECCSRCVAPFFFNKQKHQYLNPVFVCVCVVHSGKLLIFLIIIIIVNNVRHFSLIENAAQNKPHPYW